MKVRLTFSEKAGRLFVGIVMLQHLGFLILEVFLYQHPIGLKVFKITPEFAEATAHIMFNQGIYNGFLAGALLLGLIHPCTEVRKNFSLYGLVCVVLAGIAGAVSVSSSIFFIQSVPALIGTAYLLRMNSQKVSRT